MSNNEYTHMFSDLKYRDSLRTTLLVMTTFTLQSQSKTKTKKKNHP